MKPGQQLRFGALGAAVAGVCCFTPLLAVTLALAGLGAAVAWLDLVLLPVLAASMLLAGLGGWRLWRARHAGAVRRRDEASMEPLTLVYFDGCPNAPRARAALHEAGLAFEEVLQDDLPPGHPLRGYTSPSILAGERLLYGTDAGESGCSVSSPNPALLRQALQAPAER
jgi:mercuric ion transport protein